MKRNKKGFTLVEVIVVLVILGILLAIAIPNVINYIDKANNKSAELAARNVFLAAQVEAAEMYGKYRRVVPASMTDAVRTSAGLAASETFTINLDTTDNRTVTSVVYRGITYSADGTVTGTPTP